MADVLDTVQRSFGARGIDDCTAFEVTAAVGLISESPSDVVVLDERHICDCWIERPRYVSAIFTLD